MNKRGIVTLFIIIAVSLLACTPKSIEPTQSVPLTKPAQSPTKDLPAQPTSTRSAPVKPTKTTLAPLPATPEGSGFQPEMYYTEEFEIDADTVNYYSFYMLSGSVDSVEIEDIDDTLWFTFSQPRTSIVYLYDAYEYEEVNITAAVHFTDNSKGAVKLICKYNPDIGWYEFNVRLDGTFDIKAAMFENNDVVYETLYEGETNRIKFNGDPNEFHANCSEDSLHIDFNESKGWAVDIPSNVPNIPSGQVGFGIESESSLPVKIGVDQFVIEENN